MKILIDLLRFALKFSQDVSLQRIEFLHLQEGLILRKNQYLKPFLLLNLWKFFFIRLTTVRAKKNVLPALIEKNHNQYFPLKMLKKSLEISKSI